MLKEYNHKEFCLYTITEINVLSRNRSKTEKAIRAAFDRMNELGKRMNYFDPGSELSKLNSKAYWEEVTVSDELFEIIKKSVAGSEKTNGAFDVTATSLTRLYGFGTKESNVPTNKMITKELTNVGYKYIKLNEANKSIKYLKRGLQIDLGGILKGYAVDKGIKVLQKHGIENGLINAGGNIYALGTNKGKNWRIGIKNPSNTGNITEIIELSNNACATSGDYEQYFYNNETKYSHIINPRTGKPSNLESGIHSVTVIADTACEADILSTAAYVLGKDKASKLIDNQLLFF